MSERVEVTQRRLEIFSLAFDEGAVIAGYMWVPDDVRVEGAVALQHTVRIDLGHPDYGEDAEMLRHAARRLVKNALEDFADSQPWTPDEEDDDDDERGMGDG